MSALDRHKNSQGVKLLWLLRRCSFSARRLRELAEGRPKEHRVFYLAGSSVTAPRIMRNLEVFEGFAALPFCASCRALARAFEAKNVPLRACSVRLGA